MLRRWSKTSWSICRRTKGDGLSAIGLYSFLPSSRLAVSTLGLPRNTDSFVTHRDDDVIPVVARGDRDRALALAAGVGSRGYSW
jgi:hypothetical protein